MSFRFRRDRGPAYSLLYSLLAHLEAPSEFVHPHAAPPHRPTHTSRYLDDNREDVQMAALIKRWVRSILGLSDETLRQLRREAAANVRHLKRMPQAALLRWYSEACPGTSSMVTLFLLGEDAGSCLRIIGNEGNQYNRALMGYVLQSHVRALVVRDASGRVLARSLVRLLLRSDTLTPVIFCDPVFFTKHYSRELQASLHAQARALELHTRVPVVHAGSLLPLLDPPLAEGGHVRRVEKLGHSVVWVDLLEMDGIAPYTYSEARPTCQTTKRPNGNRPTGPPAHLPRRHHTIATSRACGSPVVRIPASDRDPPPSASGAAL